MFVYGSGLATSFPDVDDDDDTVVSAGWVDLGETEGGVTVRHTQNVELLSTDQHISAVKALRSEEGLEVEFSLAELTLENYAVAMGAVSGVTNDTTPTTKIIGLTRGVEPLLKSLLIRGRSPYGDFGAQYEIPMAVQTAEPEVQMVKDDKSVLACTFTGMADLTASDPDETFGRLIAQVS